MITRAQTILDLLRERPRTFAELLEETKLPESIVRSTLIDLRRSGYLESAPTSYSATPKAAQGGKPKIQWSKPKAEPRVPKRTSKKPSTYMRAEDPNSKISRILAAYQSGEPLTYLEVAAISGLDTALIKTSACRLIRYGLLETASVDKDRRVRLKLTQAGKSAPNSRDDEPPAMEAEATIKSAMRSRPALEQFWGAMA